MKKRLCETRGTIQYFIKYRWKDINKRTINGNQSHRILRKNNSGYLKKQIRLEMTKAEFKAWCMSNKEIILNYYDKGLIPSIDRLDSSGPYSLSNIRILEVNKNRAKVIIF